MSDVFDAMSVVLVAMSVVLVAMFAAFRVPRGPGGKTQLYSVRQIKGIDETGLQFNISDTRKLKPHDC